MAAKVLIAGEKALRRAGVDREHDEEEFLHMDLLQV